MQSIQRKPSPLEGEGWVGGAPRENGACGITPSRRAMRADLPPQGGGEKEYVLRRIRP
jgi:hypothetical protein